MAEIPLGSKAQELFPESHTQYFPRDEPTRVIFDVNTDGSVTGLNFITTLSASANSRSLMPPKDFKRETRFAVSTLGRASSPGPSCHWYGQLSRL
jgi:hypothetical protein